MGKKWSPTDAILPKFGLAPAAGRFSGKKWSPTDAFLPKFGQDRPVRTSGWGRGVPRLDGMPQTSPTPSETGTQLVKRGLAEMLKGGVIMDVVDPEQAKIAEDAGAVAVMALERVPSDIRRDGGVARMSDPEMIEGIQAVCTIPVMAKARIGHFVEAQILEALGVDYIDESEVLTPADEAHHIDKWAFTVPFVCGATNLGEALRRISEGACMIRSKGEAGTGNVVEAVRHLRSILGDIRKITQADNAELFDWAKKLQAPLPVWRAVPVSTRIDAPQTTLPASTGPSSVSTNIGPFRVPITMTCFSPAFTTVPLATTMAKALNSCGSSCATAAAAGRTRATASASVRRTKLMVCSPLT